MVDKHPINSFRSEESGSVAIFFGIGLVVLMACAGLTIDFLRAESVKTALQQDLDATMLRVVRQKFAQTEYYDVQQAAIDSMRGLSGRLSHANSATSISVAAIDDATYVGTAKVNVSTSLIRVLGFSSIPIEVTSTAKTGVSPVEIVLVLDNTLSMQGSKIDSLKSASKELIDAVLSAPNGARYARIGIVPFSRYVNVGLANRNQSWISVPSDSSSISNVCTDQAPATVVPGSCRQETYPYTADGEPMTGTRTRCDYTYGPVQHTCRDVTTTHTWHGCVGSRPSPWDLRDENYLIKVPGILDASCASEVLPLTNNISSLNQAVDAMTAVGDTYIPSGLLWGWLSLSEIAPYEAPGKIEGATPRKIIVLMTDGFNTLSPTVPYNGTHNGQVVTLADYNTQQLCSAVKDNKIEVFTVAFDVTNSNIKQILQDCATTPVNFFDATNDAQLAASFKNIAKNLAALRIAQ